MNIVIFGAGAIGSLFGALLYKKNNVVLIGISSHVNAIKKNGLKITGKTNMSVNISSEDSVDNVTFSVDLLILTVKSHDTKSAINQAKKIIDDNTVILSLQNGLDNIDNIKKIIDSNQIIAGVTTYGAIFSEPGIIKHTGIGQTILGELNTQESERLNNIVKVFNEVGIETAISMDIIKEIWIKTIVNSSINPLTTLFQCKNGYLLKNPILEKIVEKVCKESVNIANAAGTNLSYQDMVQKTKEVIRNTSDNYSSMLQSTKKNKKTEIDSINGRLAEIGRMHNIDCSLNEILVYLIKSRSRY